MQLFERIQTLCSAYGPSGDEAEIRSVIRSMAEPFADEIREDVLGNLMVHRKGTGPRVLFSAHMDSIGFLVTHIEKEGFLRVGRLGGIVPKEAVFSPIRMKNGTCGTFVPEEKAEKKLSMDNCYVDIGAGDEEEARKLVQPGDTAVYATPCRLQNRTVISPYLDNRVSCAILLEALERIEDSPNDLWFLFSVQEEVGTRGVKTAAWGIDPDYGIAVDVTDVCDTPGTARYGTTELRKGAAIKVMDSSIICHPAVVAKLQALAEKENIPVQRDIMRAGGTDAGSIHVTRSGVQTGGISVPCRYIHTPAEEADMEDVEACIRLTVAFATAALEKN